jgi:hypothetical protein
MDVSFKTDCFGKRTQRRINMKTAEIRVEKLEQVAPAMERRFVGWSGNPWTAEQMAQAIRLHPEQRVFWRSLHEMPARGARGPSEGG